MSDIKGIEISNIFGLEKPLTKLIECVSAGTGKVYEPTYIRRMAKAKSDEIKLIGETLTENINLPAKYEDGKIVIDTMEAEELIKRTGNRVLYKELRKQQNIDSVIGTTSNLLEDEEKVTSEPVNVDWLYQFFDMAGEISDEHMQKLWAKILAGEIKQPNTYTLRTLNTLKNITTKEALLFEQLMQFVIFHDKEPLMYKNYSLLMKYGITFDNLLILEDCGLINLNGNVLLKTETCTLYNLERILFFDKDITFSEICLSESGKQIINLIKNSIKSNNEYFLEVCNELRQENFSIQFNAYKIKNMNNKRSDYHEENDLLVSEN